MGPGPRGREGARTCGECPSRCPQRSALEPSLLIHTLSPGAGALRASLPCLQAFTSHSLRAPELAPTGIQECVRGRGATPSQLFPHHKVALVWSVHFAVISCALLEGQPREDKVLGCLCTGRASG